MNFEQVRDALAQQFEVDPESITPDTNLIDDLGADSLDVVELIMRTPPSSTRCAGSLSIWISCSNSILIKKWPPSRGGHFLIIHMYAGRASGC